MEGKGGKTSDSGSHRPRARNFSPLDLLKTNKKSVSLGLVVIGAFALLSTVLSVNLSGESVEDLEENENAKSSSEFSGPVSVQNKGIERVGFVLVSRVSWTLLHTHWIICTLGSSVFMG